MAYPAPCRIATGKHQVSSSAQVATFLVPFDVKPRRALPVRSMGYELFEGVYTF